MVAYEIYRRGNKYGQPPGLLGRSEFGMEIIIAIGYQVYCVGLSLEKACEVLSFFQQLKLRKSQADALLNQLARCWESEFDTLCMLLANSAVVHCDETSWSINSVWAFLNDKLTVLFYGVHKDGATLAEILDKEVFAGVLISIISSVLQSIGKQVSAFTLEHVINEVQRWMNRGRSCFSDQAKARGLKPPDRDKPLLDQLILDAGRWQVVDPLTHEPIGVYFLCPLLGPGGTSP